MKGIRAKLQLSSEVDACSAIQLDYAECLLKLSRVSPESHRTFDETNNLQNVLQNVSEFGFFVHFIFFEGHMGWKRPFFSILQWTADGAQHDSGSQTTKF